MTFNGVVRFDESQLARALARLPRQHRTAFAAMCAERLFPSYVAFANKTGTGEPNHLRSILSRLWDDLAGDRMSGEEIQAQLEACMKLIPAEDAGPWVMEKDFAEDAVAAVAYAFECRKTGRSEEAARSARRAYEAIDDFVIIGENFELRAPGTEERILAHPLIQTELARQRRDLAELGSVGEGELARKIVTFRQRASTEGSAFFEASQG